MATPWLEDASYKVGGIEFLCPVYGVNTVINHQGKEYANQPRIKAYPVCIELRHSQGKARMAQPVNQEPKTINCLNWA